MISLCTAIGVGAGAGAGASTGAGAGAGAGICAGAREKAFAGGSAKSGEASGDR
jgi:hypothetical protein